MKIMLAMLNQLLVSKSVVRYVMKHKDFADNSSLITCQMVLGQDSSPAPDNKSSQKINV